MSSNRIFLVLTMLVMVLTSLACARDNTAGAIQPQTKQAASTVSKKVPPAKDVPQAHRKVLYVAGGCFWGIEAYFERIPGVLDAISGYANGKFPNPTYEQVSHEHSGHAETVKVVYDDRKISYGDLLRYFFRIIDPTSINRQGNDVGENYRTGIYYTDPAQERIARQIIAAEQPKYTKKITVEVVPLKGFYKAEAYHQDYLQKHPFGYCHINLNLADKPLDN